MAMQTSSQFVLTVCIDQQNDAFCGDKHSQIATVTFPSYC